MRNVIAVVAMTALSAGSVAAQSRDAAPVPLGSQDLRELKELRYQIRQMEAVLEGAVEHGATVMRDRLRVALPTDMLLTEEARVRGFRLEGYGVFFDVEVPSLEGPLPWSFQTLEQSDLGIQSALETLRSFVQGRAGNDANVQQALRRVELQVTPVGVARVASNNGNAPGAGQQPEVVVPLTQDQVNQSYRETISAALIDAMLEHSRGLNIAPNEVLSVAARGAGDQARLSTASAADGQTWLIRVSGTDLTLFLGGQITREEAVKRVSVKVF
jgi:hypothetical protein